MTSNHHFEKHTFRDYLALAKLRWLGANIRGYGRWAVPAPGVVTLYEDRSSAEKQGGEIIDLARTPVIDTCKETSERR